jgi:hypothetical protein
MSKNYSALSNVNQNDELILFHSFYEIDRAPMRADASALGSLPTRAFRYCEAIRKASAFGWYIFPALNFSLLWESDGNGLSWRCDDVKELGHWQPLSDAVQFPGQSVAFDNAAPADVRGFSPPWLTRMWEPGHVQIWSGLAARTRAGCSLLVRPVANLPRSGGYEVFEGFIEADRWFGPLFSNVRLTRPDHAVEFRTNWPIAQVQTVPRSVYTDQALDRVVTVRGLDEFTEEDWNDFRQSVVAPSLRPNRSFGEDAVSCRRRARNSSSQEVVS